MAAVRKARAWVARTSFCHPMTNSGRHRWSPGRVRPRGTHALRENVHRTSPRKILLDGHRRLGGVVRRRKGTSFPMEGDDHVGREGEEYGEGERKVVGRREKR